MVNHFSGTVLNGEEKTRPYKAFFTIELYLQDFCIVLITNSDKILDVFNITIRNRLILCTHIDPSLYKKHHSQ